MASLRVNSRTPFLFISSTEQLDQPLADTDSKIFRMCGSKVHLVFSEWDPHYILLLIKGGVID
jgi:hypothetical protein